MTLRRTAQMALIVGCAFAAGWTAATTSPLPSALAQQPHRDPVEANFIALYLGLATVSVDAEMTAARTNELGDRLAKLERRVLQLETRR